MRGADTDGLEPPAKRRCSGDPPHESPVLRVAGALAASRPTPDCSWVFDPAAGAALRVAPAAADRRPVAPQLQPWADAAGLAAFADRANFDALLAADLGRATGASARGSRQRLQTRVRSAVASAAGRPAPAPAPPRAASGSPRAENVEPLPDAPPPPDEPAREEVEAAPAAMSCLAPPSQAPPRAAPPAAPAGRPAAGTAARATEPEGPSHSQQLLSSPGRSHLWRASGGGARAAPAAQTSAGPVNAASTPAAQPAAVEAPPASAPPPPPAAAPPPQPVDDTFLSPAFGGGAYSAAAVLPAASLAASLLGPGAVPDSVRGWRDTPGSGGDEALPAAALLPRFEDTAPPLAAALDGTVVPETAMVVPESPAPPRAAVPQPAVMAPPEQPPVLAPAPAATDLGAIFAFIGGGEAAPPPPPGASNAGGLFSYDASPPLRSAAASAAAALLPAWQNDGAARAMKAPASWASGVSIVSASGFALLPAGPAVPPARHMAAPVPSPPAATIPVYCDGEEDSPAAAAPPLPAAHLSMPPPPAPHVASLFSIGGGRTLTVSAAAMARGAALFGADAAPAAVQVPAPTNVASGFQAAGTGRALVVSAAALARAGALFGGDGSGDSAVVPAASPAGFALATGAPMPPLSAAAAARAAALMGDAAPVVSAGGFASAAGTKLPPPSAASAARAASMMADLAPSPAPAAPPAAAGGFRPPMGRTSLAATPSPAVHNRGRGRFIAPKAATPLTTPLAPSNGQRSLGAGRSEGKVGSPTRRMPALSPFAAPPLPPVLPAAVGPMHDLRASLRATGPRIPLRVFFGGALPWAASAPPGKRPTARLPETHVDAAEITAAGAVNVILPSPGPVRSPCSLACTRASDCWSCAAQFGPFSHELARWTLIARHGASDRLATPEWVANHWRCGTGSLAAPAPGSQLPLARSFIVWKLASYERAFPATFASRRALCVDRVLDELRLRYEREHNRCDFVALRAGCERML